MKLTEQLEEIARQVANRMDDEMGLGRCTSDEWPVEFAARFLAALPKPKPVYLHDDAQIQIGQDIKLLPAGTPLYYTTPPQPDDVRDAWQPIETAPKDVFLLLAGPSGYTTIETVFTTGRMCSDYRKGRWIDHANDNLTDWGFVPAYWMPIPEAPAIAAAKGEV